MQLHRQFPIEFLFRMWVAAVFGVLCDCECVVCTSSPIERDEQSNFNIGIGLTLTRFIFNSSNNCIRRKTIKTKMLHQMASLCCCFCSLCSLSYNMLIRMYLPNYSSFSAVVVVDRMFVDWDSIYWIFRMRYIHVYSGVSLSLSTFSPAKLHCCYWNLC